MSTSGVKLIEATYKASDGTTFTNLGIAESYEDLAQALEQFTAARKSLHYKLARAIKTADGKHFGFHEFYYRIRWDFDRCPELQEVYIDFSQLLEIEYEDDALRWKLMVRRYRAEDETFYFDELYESRKTARLELVKKQDAWLAQWQKRVNEERTAAERMR